MAMLAGDLVWITPENLHHFLSEGAVLKFLRKQIAAQEEPRYVDLVSIKSSPSADNIMTVAYEVNLVSREDERPLYLRCSMAICRRSKRLEITFLHFSKKSERDSTEQLQDFVTNLPCGVMILACLDGRREEAIYYNDYFAHRLRYQQEEFARAIRRNPFFMTSEEERDRIHEEIERARKNGGSIAANMRFYRRDGNSFYFRMKGAPAYQANGGTVYYCVFQETTSYQLNADRLQDRLETATEIIRQIPEAVCGIEYSPGSRTLQALMGSESGKTRDAESADRGNGEPAADGDDVREYVKSASKASKASKEDTARMPAGPVSGEGSDTRTYKKHKESLRRSDKDARVFFTSRNIPALFGVSNSAYMRNILEDPFFGLEITSITRDRLLSSHLFNSEKASIGKTVSCGIFRLQKPDGKSLRVELAARRVQNQDGTMRLYLFYYDREEQQRDTEKRVDRAMKMGRAGQEQLRADLKKAKENAARRQSELKSELAEAKENLGREMSRIEDQLVEEKNRCALMARQLDESRATQKQMAAELERSETNASKRIRNYQAQADHKVAEAQAQADKARREADEKVREAKAAAEEETGRIRREADEKIREIRAAAEEEIDRAQQSSDERISDAQAEAEKAVREARRTEDERGLLEEQLREAQERSRILEAELKNERARRFLLEEQIRKGSKSLPELMEMDAVRAKDLTAGAAAVPAAAGAAAVGMTSGAMAGIPAGAAAAGISAGAAAGMPAGTAGTGISAGASVGIPTGTAAAGISAGAAAGMQAGTSASGRPSGAASNGMPAGTGTIAAQTEPKQRPGDWMTTEKPLTIFSSMDVERHDPGQESMAETGAADLRIPKPDALTNIYKRADAPADTYKRADAPADTYKKADATADTYKKADATADKYKKANAAANTYIKADDPANIFESTSEGHFAYPDAAPEAQPAVAENRIRAQEYDRAKGRLRNLMEMADAFLRDADSSASPAYSGEGQVSPGFSTPCSRENISAVMSDFLEAASPAEGLLKEKPFSPEKCLQSVLIFEGMECEERGISLRLCHDSALPEKVTGFGSMLQRALCELVEQAVRRTRRGGSITVCCRADRPSEGLVNLHFRIDDNGTRISEGEMQTLFESKMSAGTEEPLQSGLFSAREAATLMGGSIHARSGRRGTRFTLTVTVRIHEM